MKRRLHFDFETYSEADIKKVGSDVYAQHPSTEVLMCAYAFDDDPVQIWVPAKDEPLPQELLRAWLDQGTVKFAWNKPFEWSILKHVLGVEIPHNQWRDPMILAMTCSFPGSLDSVGEILGLDEDKRKLSRGKALIRKFCVPRKPTKANPSLRLDHRSNPAEWAEFEGYCRNDVVAERAIWEKLRPYDLPVHEWNYWVLDQAINQAGIPINVAAVQGACRIYEEAVDGYMAELREITGLENPNSSAQILPWLQARGYPFEDLKKGHVQRAVERCDNEIADSFDDPDRVAELQQLKHVMDLRLKSASASVKKYYALQRATAIDGSLRNCFQFAGAQRTWRWAGRIFQPQNLPSPTGFYQIRKTEKIEDYAARLKEYVRQVQFLHAPDIQLIYGDPIEMLKSLVRPMAHVPDPETQLFVDADLNAIENRVLGWIANDRKILEVFEKRRDPYIAFASYMFGLPYEQLYAEYKAGDGKKRKIAKPGTLGCFRADTPVLTHTGWKAIIEVCHTDWLWDGEKWVRHEGVVRRGQKAVLSRAGIHATPDHLILVERKWTPWAQVVEPMTFQRAIGSMDGPCLRMSELDEAQGKSFDADAFVAESETSPDQISCDEYPSAAPDALRLVVAPNSESGLAQSFSTYSQIVSTLRDRVAKTPTVRVFSGMAEGEFVCGSVTRKTGCSIWSKTSVQTDSSKLIELTTTDTMSGATSDWPRVLSKNEIAETWDILNSGDCARFVVLTDDGCLVAHNCGYMLGPGEEVENRKTGEMEATGLLGYAWNMGVKLTLEESQLSVSVFRETYHQVKKFWYAIEAAALECVRTGKRTECNMLEFDLKGPFLRMRLPSERHLHYYRPKLEMKRTPWGEMRENLTYEGLNAQGQWVRVSTHPGKLTENADQAISRDLIAHGMRLAYREGIDVRLHVHDQIVGLTTRTKAERDLQVLQECMGVVPGWAPGLPLGSAGHVSPVFLKD
jgi:DNA polymerase bacteriophage-type